MTTAVVWLAILWAGSEQMAPVDNIATERDCQALVRTFAAGSVLGIPRGGNCIPVRKLMVR